MRAISIRQPWATLISLGHQKHEDRSRRIALGPLLICASAKPKIEGMPTGVALAIVDVVAMRARRDGFRWELANVRQVAPFAVRGWAAIFHVREELLGVDAPSSPPVAESMRSPSPRRAPATIVLPRGARYLVRVETDPPVVRPARSFAEANRLAVRLATEHGMLARAYKPGFFGGVELAFSLPPGL